MIKKVFLSFFIVILLVSGAWATTSTTTNFGLPKPPLGTLGTAEGFNTKMDAADTAIQNAINGAKNFLGLTNKPEITLGDTGYTTGLTAAVTTIGATPTTLVVSGAVSINADTPLPATLELKPLKGALITIGTTSTGCGGTISCLDASGAGTITTTTNSIVIGVSTAFGSACEVGQYLKTNGGQRKRIISIEDDTHLTCESNFTAEAGVAYKLSTRTWAGSGTGFVAGLAANDWVYISGVRYRVISITNDTGLVTDKHPTAEIAASTAFTRSVRLTIQGGIQVGLYQWLAGNGRVNGDQYGVTEIFPQWWGALADNGTTADNSPYINQAANQARASKCATINIPGALSTQSMSGAHFYTITSTIDLRGLNIKAGTASFYPGNFVGPQCLIGNINAAQINLPSFTASGAIVPGAEGIRITNLQYSSDVVINSCRGFWAGVRVLEQQYNAGSETAYNVFKVGQLDSCWYAFKVEVYGNGTDSWSNANTVIGGSYSSAAAEAIAPIHLYHCESWHFYGPILQYGYGTCGPIFDKSIECNVNNAYIEPGTALKTIAVSTNNAAYNKMTVAKCAITAPYVLQTATSNICVVTFNRDADTIINPFGISRADAWRHSDGTVSTPGWEYIGTATNSGIPFRQGPADNTFLFETSAGISAPGVNSSWGGGGGIGFTVHFTDAKSKSLRIVPNVKGTSTMYCYFRCYDAVGAVLTNENGADGLPLVSGSGRTWNNSWKTTWTYVDPGNQVWFNSDIYYVQIILADGDNLIPGLKVYSPSACYGFLGYTSRLFKAAPETLETPGNWIGLTSAHPLWPAKVGRSIKSGTPTSGQPTTITCNKATLTTTTQAQNAGDSTIQVASISGISSGDDIHVKMPSGSYHSTTVNGAPSGSTVTLTAVIPAGGIASGAWVTANTWLPGPNYP